MRFDSRASDTQFSLLERAGYRLGHVSAILSGAPLHAAMRGALRLSSCATGQGGARPATVDRETAAKVRKRALELIEQEIENVEKGFYPKELVFDVPLRRYAKMLPATLRDLKDVFRRIAKGNYQDISHDKNPRDYPAYYRRNFHWQTDGYLSRRSAKLYDLQVEYLFLGCADVMRRQILPPLIQQLHDKEKPKILDVATGTARILRQIKTALPNADLTGIDMSPYYIEEARESVGPETARFLVGKAEELPFSDADFDAITSVYLFHELPRNVRRRVAKEIARCLRPDGIAVIMDSCQYADSSSITAALDRFGQEYHEPFYRDYLKDDLEAIFTAEGLDLQEKGIALVSRYLVFRKPDA